MSDAATITADESPAEVDADASRPTMGKRLRPYLPVLIVVAMLTVLPVLGMPNRLVHLAVVCLIWTTAAYGLFVPYAFAGQITVAIVTTWGVGAFATGLAIKYWEWPFLACLGLAVASAFVAGALMAMPILRTKGHYFVIVTFVIAEAVAVAANNWSVTSGTGGSGISIADTVTVFGIDFSSRVSMFYLCLAIVAIVALFVTWLRDAPLGRQLASIRENEELARSLGIPTTWLKILVLAIGGAITGLSGTLYAYYLSHIGVELFGVNQAITLILIVVIGGRMSILGPLIGAGFAYYLPEVINLDPNRVIIAYGVVLGLVVIFLPTGVLGGVDSLRSRLVRSRANGTSDA